jgi:hypothetical protein
MKQFVSLLLLSALIVTVSAAPSFVNNPAFQAEVGEYRNTAQGGFEVRDNGNSPAVSNATAAGTTTACGDNILVSTAGGSANTAIVSGDLVYSVKVLARASPLPPSNTCFTVTVSYNGTPLAALFIKTSTPSAGDFAICKWDLGVTSLPALYTLKVSVQ